MVVIFFFFFDCSVLFYFLFLFISWTWYAFVRPFVCSFIDYSNFLVFNVDISIEALFVSNAYSSCLHWKFWCVLLHGLFGCRAIIFCYSWARLPHTKTKASKKNIHSYVERFSLSANDNLYTPFTCHNSQLTFAMKYSLHAQPVDMCCKQVTNNNFEPLSDRTKNCRKEYGKINRKKM